MESVHEKWCSMITIRQYIGSRLHNVAYIINLVVRRLNAYVGKERIHGFPVVRPVAMTQMQLSWWSGATGIQNNSSLLVIKRSSCVFLDFMCCTYGMFNKYLPDTYICPNKSLTLLLFIS